ncbi:TonB-dependent receptor plug domain-containing protein [Robbsia andropogonis]|uniref:TonB-dependent receptor plug domain-containing protein n=1 Tax=Robbsia andropogonis TaxID=28092 RepID=UPI003CC65165
MYLSHRRSHLCRSALRLNASSYRAILFSTFCAAPIFGYAQTPIDPTQTLESNTKQPVDKPQSTVPANTQSLNAISVSAARLDPGIDNKSVSSGALGSRTLEITPYSISVAGQDQIADLQAPTAKEAFKYDPAVTTVADSRTFESGEMSVRGLAIDPENGTKSMGSFPLDGPQICQWRLSSVSNCSKA